jgi:hypothetical protein
MASTTSKEEIPDKESCYYIKVRDVVLFRVHTDAQQAPPRIRILIEIYVVFSFVNLLSSA